MQIGHEPNAQSADVAFVTAGGASLGAIEAGMLRALYERAIVPDFIVGTSAGALHVAFIAWRPPAPATAEALAEVWHSLRRGDVFPLKPLTGRSSGELVARTRAVA